MATLNGVSADPTDESSGGQPAGHPVGLQGARVDISTQQGSSVVVVTWTGRLGPLEWPVRAEARVIGEGSS